MSAVWSRGLGLTGLLVGAFGCASHDDDGVAVAGTESCTEVETVAGERNRYECVEDLDDERVSGDAVVIVDDVDSSVTAWEMAGTMEIENDGGRWAGDWTGVIDDGLHIVNGALEGSGSYDGLRFVAEWQFVDWPATVTGTIESSS